MSFTLAQYRDELLGMPGLTPTRFVTGIKGELGVGESALVHGYGGSVNPALVADARRVVASSDLANQNAEGDDVDYRRDLYEGSWAYCVETEEQVWLSRQGVVQVTAADVTTVVASSTPIGYLTTAARWASILPAGRSIILARRLPLVGQGAVNFEKTVHGCINDALSAQALLFRSDLTGDGSRSIDVSYLSWLEYEDQLAQVIDPVTTYRHAGNPRLRIDGERVLVDFDYAIASGLTLTAEWYRSRKTLIYRSGAWADSTAGLVHEADAATAPLRPTALIAYWFVADHLALNDPHGELAVWALRRDRALKAAVPYMRFRQPTSRAELEVPLGATEAVPGVPGGSGSTGGSAVLDWP